MAMEIITGSTGLPHVTSIDDAVRNGNVGYVGDKCVFTYYENLRADDITANQIRIFSGYGMNQGRYFKIAKDTYEDVTIRNGTSGYKRVDLIVAKYQMDSQTGFESISLHVIEGRNGSTYQDPTWVTGDINGGDDEDDFPLYRIKLNGMALDGEPERMFNLVPDGGRIGLIERMLNTGLMTDLASETRRTLNANGAGVDIGVKGILPIGHGGTGQNSAQGGLAALAGGATANTTTPADADTILTKSGTTWYQKAFSKIWDYIKSKLMGNTNYVTVANGGTGLGTVGANKVLVGTGDASIGTKTLVTTIEDSSHDQIPTAKAVTDAMSAAGYGDMLAADYTTTVSGTKVISQGKGGTGSKDGSINGVRLGTNGNTKGYYDANNQFRSFRQPTGNAAVGNVLSGKTFANASSDALTGTMANYSGSSRRTVTPSGGTGNEQLSLSAGYHDSVIVNRTNPYNTGYNAGVAAAQGATWTETLFANATGNGQNKYSATLGLPYKNVVKIKNISSWPLIIQYKTSSGVKSQTLAANAEMTPPAGAIVDTNWISYWNASYDRTSDAYFSAVYVLVTFQTKVLR